RTALLHLPAPAPFLLHRTPFAGTMLPVPYFPLKEPRKESAYHVAKTNDPLRPVPGRGLQPPPAGRSPARSERGPAAGRPEGPPAGDAPRRNLGGQLLLAAREVEPESDHVPGGGERLHRRRHETHRAIPGRTLPGDARPHPGD